MIIGHAEFPEEEAGALRAGEPAFAEYAGGQAIEENPAGLRGCGARRVGQLLKADQRRKGTAIHYLAHLMAVSACDRLHNARAIVEDLREHGPAMMSRFNAGLDGTLWYYRSLANAFARLLPGRLSGELARAVDEMERLAA